MVTVRNSCGHQGSNRWRPQNLDMAHLLLGSMIHSFPVKFELYLNRGISKKKIYRDRMQIESTGAQFW